MKNSDKLAHHLHIPLQAGSNNILKAMNRPYTVEDYKNRIAYIREQIKGVSISTDLIVGFPGESEDDFNETLNNLKDIKFSFIHCFPYARKSGTKADKLEGHLDERIKKERLYKVQELEKEYTLKYRSSFLNKEMEMLVEKVSDDKIYGYVKEYFYICTKGKARVGDIVKVTIDEVNENEVLAHVS